MDLVEHPKQVGTGQPHFMRPVPNSIGILAAVAGANLTIAVADRENFSHEPWRSVAKAASESPRSWRQHRSAAPGKSRRNDGKRGGMLVEDVSEGRRHGASGSAAQPRGVDTENLAASKRVEFSSPTSSPQSRGDEGGEANEDLLNWQILSDRQKEMLHEEKRLVESGPNSGSCHEVPDWYKKDSTYKTIQEKGGWKWMRNEVEGLLQAASSTPAGEDQRLLLSKKGALEMLRETWAARVKLWPQTKEALAKCEEIEMIDDLNKDVKISESIGEAEKNTYEAEKKLAASSATEGSTGEPAESCRELTEAQRKMIDACREAVHLCVTVSGEHMTARGEQAERYYAAFRDNNLKFKGTELKGKWDARVQTAKDRDGIDREQLDKARMLCPAEY